MDGMQDLPNAQQDADAELLQRYANGDAAAARLLTARLVPRLHGHALRVLGDRAEAEDVAQEAMLRLWRQAPKWRRGEAKVTTWLYRVVANLCTDRLRRRGAGAGPLCRLDCDWGPAQRAGQGADPQHRSPAVTPVRSTKREN